MSKADPDVDTTLETKSEESVKNVTSVVDGGTWTWDDAAPEPKDESHDSDLPIRTPRFKLQ